MNNKIGGAKMRETIVSRYGEEYWVRLGKLGGKKGKAHGVVKGFAQDPERARIAGQLGGTIGKRGKDRLTAAERKALKEQFWYFQKQSDEQKSRLNAKYGVRRPW